MPKRKRFSSKKTVSRKKRRFLRRRRRFRRYRVSPRNSLFTQSRKVNLKYCETLKIAGAVSNVFNRYVFRANSIYDPNYTGAGHQPLGRDIYAELYDQYMVIGSKIIVTATVQDNTPPMMVGIFRTDDFGDPGVGKSTLMEQPNFRYKICSDAMPVRLISHTFSKRKMFRNTDNTSLTSSMASNPTEQVFYQILTMNQVQDNAQTDIQLDVTIYYTCILTEPKTIAAS